MNKYKRIKFFGDKTFKENYWDWCIEEQLHLLNESQFEENSLQEAILNQKVLHLYFLMTLLGLFLLSIALYDYNMRTNVSNYLKR